MARDMEQVVANQDTGKSKWLVESYFPLWGTAGNTPTFKQHHFPSELGKRFSSIWLMCAQPDQMPRVFSRAMPDSCEGVDGPIMGRLTSCPWWTSGPGHRGKAECWKSSKSSSTSQAFMKTRILTRKHTLVKFVIALQGKCSI